MKFYQSLKIYFFNFTAVIKKTDLKKQAQELNKILSL